MNFLSVNQIAKKWNISTRMVRNYCEQGRIPNAFLTGKTWNIPLDAVKPQKEIKVVLTENALLNILNEQRISKLKGNIYQTTIVEFTYNSNRLSGNKLNLEQVQSIFETNILSVEKSININDIIETVNHIKCLDYIIENAKKPLTESLIKELHFILKFNTTDSAKNWFNVGDYKKMPNEFYGEKTTIPKNVKSDMQNLLNDYNSIEEKTLETIVEFHTKFEKIHPFQDGNGRIGRLIMFKECLNNDILPFIIDEYHKLFYYRGLKEWNNQKWYLIDTCLSCQDKYKTWLDDFQIEYF